MIRDSPGWITPRWRVFSRERGHLNLGSDVSEARRWHLGTEISRLTPSVTGRSACLVSGPCCFGANNTSLLWTPTEFNCIIYFNIEKLPIPSYCSVIGSLLSLLFWWDWKVFGGKCLLWLEQRGSESCPMAHTILSAAWKLIVLFVPFYFFYIWFLLEIVLGLLGFPRWC